MQHKISKSFSIIVVLAMLALTVAYSGSATAAPFQAISLVGGAYTQNFDTLSNAAATTTNVLTITDWYMTETGGGARDNEQYGVDTGASTTGDTYSYGSASATDRALGGLQSGTLIPSYGAKFTNNTGATITSLDISYTGEQWRLGTASRIDQIDFQLSLDATDLITGTWTDYNSLDFIAPVTTTTGAKDGNAAANRTAISYTITGLSIANGATFWIRWNDFNATSSDDGLAVDDFSITPNGGPVTPNLSVTDVTQNEGNAGTTTFTFTVNLSAPAGVGGVTFDIATQDNTATDANNDYEINTLTGQTISSGNSTYNFSVTVNGDTSAESNETFYVNVTNVTGATVTKGQGVGTITNDDIAVTMIHDVQGNSSSTPIPGSTVTVDAIVVGDYQTQGTSQIKGFFIQEENADVDADPNTSEGIFVYCNTCTTAVSVGDRVQVTGTVSEFSGMTEITPGSVAVISSGNTLPSASVISLPIPGVPTGDLAVATSFINDFYEKYEGMLVSYSTTLYVSEYFELARYGQVELTANGRAHTYTAYTLTPPTALGYTNHLIDLASRTIILDDTDNRQNRPVDVPNTAYFFPTPGLSTSNYFRGGDTITGLAGVLDWYASAWRIRPVTEAYSYTFTPTNPRPSVPVSSGRIKVASFNVLNYFLTVDTTSSSSSGPCGPLATLDCRGADNATELSRQRTKMLAALSAIDADVFGFMEMENTTGVEPLADIVAGLPGYDYIDTGVIGGDAIRVGIIYKTATVVPVGSFVILDSSVDPLFDDSRNRPALAQTFEEIASGERFTVVVNHLKSKGSACGAGDDDTTTGQGNCNLTRTNAANALATWLATDPTGSGDPDFLIIGDLNSYAKEAPIVALQTAGYTDLVNLFGGASAYGYVFDGQLGYLDHALSNSSLTPQVAGVAEWHINADEIPLFDYNDDTKDTGESTFEEESDVTTLYSADPYRTSDHDPIIISLNLDATPPVVTVPANMTVEATSASGAVVNFTASALDNVDGPLTPSCAAASGSTFPIATSVVMCSATDAAGNTGYGNFSITVEDTTAPTLNLPANITVPQTNFSGAIVTYIVTATDLVDSNPTVVCAPLSGSNFPVGTTTVNCSATDDYNNTSNGSFTVTVTASLNLLKKPDFPSANAFPTPWQLFGVKLPYASALDCTIYQSPFCSVYFPAGNRSAMQKVLRSGFAGDTYKFGLSSMSQNAPIGGNYRVEVSFFNNFNRPVGSASISFSPLTHTWETISGNAAATGNYNRIVFRFYYQNSSGRAWFDDAFLFAMPTPP